MAQHGRLLLGRHPALHLASQVGAQALDLGRLVRERFSLGVDLELGLGQLDAGRFGGLLFALDSLLCLGQVGGLLGSLARQGVPLGGQCSDLLL